MPTVEKGIEQTLADLEQTKDILRRTLEPNAIDKDLRQIEDIIRHLQNRVRVTEFDFYIDPFDDESDVDQQALALAVLKKCENDCQVYALGTGQLAVKGIYQEMADELHTVINNLEPKLKAKPAPKRLTTRVTRHNPAMAFENAEELKPQAKIKKDNE